MTQLKWLCLILIVPFTVLTAYAVQQVGYIGVFEYHLPSPAGWQVFADLVIGMTLILTWMYRDAAAKRRQFWVFALITLILGSFGPLLYLLLAPSRERMEDSMIAAETS